MKMRCIVLALAALAVASGSDAQILKQRKPGLWEVQMSGQDSASAGEQAEVARHLASMPPAERAQMEAYMRQHGMGMTLGPGGVPTMVLRVCLTPQELADESGQTFLKGISSHGECQPRVQSQSASEVRIHTVCRSAGTTSEFDARIYDIAADHYAIDMTGTGPRGPMHMAQKARWLSSDCKGAAF